MPLFQLISRARKRISVRPFIAAAFGISLLISPAAWSTETVADEASASTSNIVAALTTSSTNLPSKLQRFSNRASELAMEAMGLLGIQYKYGGNTPETGLDCSGFVHYIFAEAWGKILPRTSRGLSQEGKHVDKQHLQAGDLVFFNTLKRKFSHVGIYLGDNKFIHAPSSGNVVRIESMDVSYWKNRFNGGRRISAVDQ